MDFANLPFQSNDLAKLDIAQQDEFFSELEGWELIMVNQARALKNTFSFGNYKDAWMFVNKVSALAEEANHHPEILLTWGKSEVIWTTHELGGISMNDFICAAKTNDLYLNKQPMLTG